MFTVDVKQQHNNNNYSIAERHVSENRELDHTKLQATILFVAEKMV